jgi:hypothetical protein
VYQVITNFNTMDLEPDSYKQNQAHLKGISTNLYDANLLEGYIFQAKHDREQKERLKEQIMNIVYECLGNIDRLKKRVKLPDDEDVINDCQNVVYGMPASEMRDLIARFGSGKLDDVHKIKAVLEYL